LKKKGVIDMEIEKINVEDVAEPDQIVSGAAGTGQENAELEWARRRVPEDPYLPMRKTEIIGTKRHPVVYGEWLGAKGAPTILVYGHYDVQPEDPLDEWKTPPFEPTILGDDLFCAAPRTTRASSLPSGDQTSPESCR
jgi:acetylornithine deacetylase/succinyl-diaminopimelate desuccinylase-like protein